ASWRWRWKVARTLQRRCSSRGQHLRQSERGGRIDADRARSHCGRWPRSRLSVCHGAVRMTADVLPFKAPSADPPMPASVPDQQGNGAVQALLAIAIGIDAGVDPAVSNRWTCGILRALWNHGYK